MNEYATAIGQPPRSGPVDINPIPMSAVAAATIEDQRGMELLARMCADAQELWKQPRR